MHQYFCSQEPTPSPLFFSVCRDGEKGPVHGRSDVQGMRGDGEGVDGGILQRQVPHGLLEEEDPKVCHAGLPDRGGEAQQQVLLCRMQDEIHPHRPKVLRLRENVRVEANVWKEVP